MNPNFLSNRLFQQSLLITATLVIGSSLLASCSSSTTAAVQETQPNRVEQANTVVTANAQTATPANTEDKKKTEPDTQIKSKSSSENRAKTDIKPKKVTKLPESGIVKEVVQGDIMCYVTLTDDKGTKHNLGATFDICATPEKFLNKKVSLVYGEETVNDCESAEPCGKSRKELLITKMTVQQDLEPTTSQQGNSETISNGEWTITIGNKNSWSGVNGTGNLSYSACSSKNDCLTLKGGRVTCRDGKCTTTWKNGIYFYTLEQPILEEPANPQQVERLTKLIVRKDSKVILNVNGFKRV